MRFLFFIGCVLAFPLSVAAVTSDFSIRTMVDGDISPPSTPSILSVIPVASSQIDITWSPAIDDVSLSGYTITRDGNHIATTSLTSFSDTGLTPATFYEYAVQAYDWRGNFSTSSSPVGTTTLALPLTPTPTTTPQASGASASGKLIMSKNVVITTDPTTALFEWGTSRPSRFELRWGRTVSYELGFVATERYREAHLTTISGLVPGTTYEYELVGYNTINDIPQVLSHGQFTTKLPAVDVVPPNVLWLQAEVSGADVTLKWKNPITVGDYTIRIVRNHLQYPTDIHDGMVVYQGKAEEFFDPGALSVYRRQYYSVFVIDSSENVSSGAVAGAERGSGDPGGIIIPGTPSIVPDIHAEPILLPLLDPSMIKLKQGDIVQNFDDATIVLAATEPFVLSIAVEHLPQQLKSIIVTLLDPTNHRQGYTFLLRLNSEKTAYETTLAPLELVGVSYLMVEIYDFGANVVGRYGKQIEFVTGVNEEAWVIFPDMFMWVFQPKSFIIVISLFIIVILLIRWWYRRVRS